MGGGIMYFANYGHIGHDVPIICGSATTIPPYCN
jgi:hypothetical protein